MAASSNKTRHRRITQRWGDTGGRREKVKWRRALSESIELSEKFDELQTNAFLFWIYPGYQRLALEDNCFFLTGEAGGKIESN